MRKELMGALLLALTTATAFAAPPLMEARLAGTQQLIVEFARPMQTWGNEVREDVVRLGAPHATRCRWDSDTRLACSIEPALKLATSYHVDVAPGLVTQAGRRLAGRRLSVETARPAVTARIVEWKAGVPQLELAATMPLVDASLAGALRHDLDGRDIPLGSARPLPPEWKGDARHRYALDLPLVEGTDRVLTLRIEPGLRAAGGPLPGRQSEMLLRARVNPAFVLRGVECPQRSGEVRTATTADTVATSCLAGEAVSLAFSEPLDAASRQRVLDGFAKAAHLDPAAVTQAAEPGRHWRRAFGDDVAAAPAGEWLDLGPLEPAAPFEFTLTGIRSQSGATLAPVTIRIATLDAQPQVRARHQRALVADGQRPPVLLQAINAGTQELEVAGVGTQPRSEAVRVRAPRTGNIPHAIESPAVSQLLAEGGWVRWQLPGTDTERRWYRDRQTVQFAAPGFDLMAVSGQREVLAWANEWDRDAPVAGAEIELLWSTDAGPPRVVARARTGADGTVVLKLPDDIAVVEPDGDDAWNWEGPMWMLRATGDDKRAVLPLGRTSSGQSLGRPVPRAFWGVSDRPLYRAGDVVHYRLWQRELHGTRLRAPKNGAPVRLRLQNQENDKVVLEWNAATAAGDIAGDLALPVHLTDATYCIGVPKSSYETEGTCFFVGTYRAQDLWAEVKSSGGVLRDGERFAATVSAGFFSGGSAGGAELARVSVSLLPEPLEAAYPTFAGYTFIEVENDETEYAEFANIKDGARLDDNGIRRMEVPVAFAGSAQAIEHRPAFARILTELEVSPEGREGTAANEYDTFYARYGRYVGLKSTPDWFDADDQVVLEAVVITAGGKHADVRDLAVDIERVTGWGASESVERVGRCVLRARVPTPCDFARTATGRYRITARAEGAAPAQLERYVWTGGGVRWAGEEEDAELTTLDVAAEGGGPARVLLKQPFERARALFVISLGGQILGHRIEAIEGNVKDVALPIAPDWRGSHLEVKAYVRELGPTRVADGYRTPARLVEAQAFLPLVAAEPSPSPSPLSLRFQPGKSTPGARAQVVLRNEGPRPLDVTLSIMDDALRAQAQRWLPYSDPHGPASFIVLTERGYGGTSQAGFDGWNDDAWRWLYPWPEQDERSAEAATLPSAPEQPSPRHRVTDPSAVDTPEEATSLDRIEVTGSRIKRADLIESDQAKAPAPGLRLDRDRGTSASPFASSQQRVRMQFADTALWNPDIRLAPGESRAIEVVLPDNLTRWRAVAWTSDGGHEFTMTEAALEVGLPVEARLQSPVRLYPGDTSQVATNVRQVAASASTAQTLLQVKGNGDESFDDAQTLALPAQGQGSVQTTLKPQSPGRIELVARAKTAAGEDAVGANVEVASPLIRTRKLQAGWIGDGGLRLALPALPAGAAEPQLQVSLLRGTHGLMEGWTHDLHVYPHRCWEQILSRAVGAAVALSRHDESWPDAMPVVKEALDNAAVFQNDDGGFFYFPGAEDNPDSHVALTAYTVRAFALLRSLGHPVPERIEAEAGQFLAAVEVPDATAADDSRMDVVHFAFAAAAKAPEEPAALDALWARWASTPLPGQVATARALADAGHPAAARAVKRLLQQAPLRGATRSLRLRERYDYWMSSDLREQCALIELLRDHPRLARANVRTQLMAGIADLYGGGAPAVDTQTAATCLMALHDSSGGVDRPASASFAVGARTQELALAQGENRRDWSAGAPDAPQLRIEAKSIDVPVSFIAELQYVEDARTAQASAVGFAIQRRYDVLRDGAWKPVEKETLRHGDWIRVSLLVESSMTREFVAVTDAVPGGLRPTDLDLSGVATSELERIGDEGSYQFETRRLDARNPRFYAESLPPGRHELHYFARVGNSGDYLAAPATAELMYGNATYARTAAARIRIEATPAE